MQETQIQYKGKYPDQPITDAQRLLLRKIGIREEVIAGLNRQTASELIHKFVAQYYSQKASKRLKPGTFVRW